MRGEGNEAWWEVKFVYKNIFSLSLSLSVSLSLCLSSLPIRKLLLLINQSFTNFFIGLKKQIGIMI